MMQTARMAASLPCSVVQPASRRAPRAEKPVFVSAGTSGRQTGSAKTLISRPFGTSHSKRASLQVAHAAQAEIGKLISKVEIPAFIPRVDLIDQLLRWSYIEVQENGMANIGCPCKVTPYMRGESVWGFTVSFLRDGVSATDVRVAFDEEVTLKHEWIGRGAGLLPNGFPMLEGNAEEIQGKNFEIRKVDEAPVSDAIRASVRDFCQMLVAAINKYYAFGSCFVDDAT